MARYLVFLSILIRAEAFIHLNFFQKSDFGAALSSCRRELSTKGRLAVIADKSRSAIIDVAFENEDARLSDLSNSVQIYDTTLRDGTQMEGVSVSVDDKIKIARAICNFGVQYIEGGWPGSNPKDAEFFERAKSELSDSEWKRIVAFGSTRRKHKKCYDDIQLQKLIAADTSCVTIVAKSWDLHVDKILEVSREENLNMVGESVHFLKSFEKEVMLDLEHFFDGMRENQSYTLDVCREAVEAGVDVLVLCDTNGGTLPWEIDEAIKVVRSKFPNVRIGIHCHNDQELAVSNSLQAVRSGATVIQGTINGIGERTGNANLVSIIPTLQLKMRRADFGENLSRITALSRFVDEQLNRLHDSKAPYVGQSAFAHKGGIHVSAVNKVEEFGMGTKEDYMSPAWKSRMSNVLDMVKRLEKSGYTFEGADATVNLMIRRLMPGYTAPFQLMDYVVTTTDTLNYNGEKRHMHGEQENPLPCARATVKMRLAAGIEKYPFTAIWDDGDPSIRLESADGNGPVNALAKALNKALLPTFPSLQNVKLKDYKVRILDHESATAANTRVLIEFSNCLFNKEWATVGVNTNIISASLSALLDGFEFALIEYAPACTLAEKNMPSQPL